MEMHAPVSALKTQPNGVQFDGNSGYVYRLRTTGQGIEGVDRGTGSKRVGQLRR
jgi:hypothetical protein